MKNIHNFSNFDRFNGHSQDPCLFELCNYYTVACQDTCMVIWNRYRIMKIYSFDMYLCWVWLWREGLRYRNTLYFPSHYAFFNTKQAKNCHICPSHQFLSTTVSGLVLGHIFYHILCHHLFIFECPFSPMCACCIMDTFSLLGIHYALFVPWKVF